MEELSPSEIFVALSPLEQGRLLRESATLSIFEIIWPTFHWIKDVRCSYDNQKFTLGIYWLERPEEAEIDSCKYLADEFLSFLSSKLNIQVSCIIGAGGDRYELPLIVMDSEVFLKVANEVAPWRLESGR